MNHTNLEATWLARIIRIFGVKELFDTVSHFADLMLRRFNLGFDSAGGEPPPRRVFWGLFSLLLAIVLFRWAKELAARCIGPVGSRPVSRSLSLADNVWFAVGIRAFGFWLVLEGAGYAIEGFYHAFSDAIKSPHYSSSSATYYLLWGALHATVGAVLCRRPDIIGVVMMTGNPNRAR